MFHRSFVKRDTSAQIKHTFAWCSYECCKVNEWHIECANVQFLLYGPNYANVQMIFKERISSTIIGLAKGNLYYFGLQQFIPYLDIDG